MSAVIKHTEERLMKVLLAPVISEKATFAAEKKESLRRPVRGANSAPSPLLSHLRTMSSVCCEIHTTTSCTGSPVLRSHITTDSR